MKIEQSNVNLASYTQSMFKYEQSSKVEVAFAYQESIQDKAKYQDFMDIKTVQSDKMIYDDESMLSPKDKVNKMIIEKLLERFFGKDNQTKLYPHKEIKDNLYIPTSNKQTSSELSWGARISVSESYYEKQTIDFKSSAYIKTNKGEFAIELSISLTQEFYIQNSMSLTFGNASLIDPLVIHYGDDTNGLDNISSLKFLFDLNNDGTLDNIPLLKKGAGFLALDKNENGKIDNGSELFGPQTSKGFEELKLYDEDKNNWIDENDSIFKSLKIWQKDETGNDNLIALSQAGIGAIYLANVTSGFSYKSSVEQTNAVLANNSIYLKESGKAGMVSEVHMVV
jgi:hypothetical protein